MKRSLLPLIFAAFTVSGCKIGGTTWPQVWIEYHNMPPISQFLPPIVTAFLCPDPSQLNAVSIEISNDENDGLWLEVRRNGELLAFQDRSSGALISRVPPKYTVKLGVDSISSSWNQFNVSIKAWDAPSGGNVIGETAVMSFTIWPYQGQRYAYTWSVNRSTFF